MKVQNSLRVSIASLVSLAGMANAQDFPQAFDDVVSLTSTGNWFQKNNSAPGGVYPDFLQGDDTIFSAQASAGYLAASFQCTAGLNTISNWFMTPALNLVNGQTFTFWTRTTDGTFPDRLQVRLSTNGFSTDCGTDALSVGDFGTLLLDINPTYLGGTGYPNNWTQYSINISGLAGATVGRIAFRYFVEDGGPLGLRSDYIGIDEATFSGTVAPVPTGSCCLPNGTCIAAQTQVQCTSVAGVYGGNGSACGACPIFGFVETTDVGNLPATAAILTGSGSLTKIVGAIDLDDADMYRINVCDRPNFSATTHGGPAIDSTLYLFNTSGTGITKDDEGGASGNHALITGQFLAGNGEVYLAISTYDHDPVNASAQRLWNETNPGNAFEPEWIPNGPGAATAVTAWTTFFGTPPSPYIITLTGACFIGGAACYANCDGSTATPRLTANDFQCFINEYAANHSYANCDGSTGNPSLTANDFQCFINKYAAGCS